MPSVTVSVPNDLKERMDDHPEINWSQVARTAIKEKVDDLEMMDRITSDSELTDEDVELLAEKVDSNVAERLVD